jgi:ribosomal protein S27E
MASKALQRKVRTALKEARENLQRFYDQSAVVLTESALKGLDNFLESAHNKEKGNNMATKTATKTATSPKAPKAKTLALVCKCGDCAHWEILLKTNSKGGSQNVLKCASCGDEHQVYFNIDPHENLHYTKV